MNFDGRNDGGVLLQDDRGRDGVVLLHDDLFALVRAVRMAAFVVAIP